MQRFKTGEFPAKCLYIWMRVFMSLVGFTVRISCLATDSICKNSQRCFASLYACSVSCDLFLGVEGAVLKDVTRCTLKIQKALCSETSVNFYHNARRQFQWIFFCVLCTQ